MVVDVEVAGAQCAAERRDMEVPYEGACVSAPRATRTDVNDEEANESGRACCCHGEATKVAIERWTDTRYDGKVAGTMEKRSDEPSENERKPA